MKRTELLLLICVACIASTDVDDLLTLGIRTSRTTLGVNDTTFIRTTLVNHSDQLVTVPVASCGPFFFVRDSLDHSYVPPQNQCVVTPSSFSIEAHDSVMVEDPWTGLAQSKEGDVGRLAPGTYSVYSAMYGTKRLLQSRTVHITLLPP